MDAIKFFWEKLKKGEWGEIAADWKWILSYSRRYIVAIIFYVILGVLSTVFTLISAVASQKLIDIVTGYEHDKIWLMALIMVGMAVFSLIFSSVVSRISLRISIDIQNEIQMDIFKKIEDASWYELSQYHSGDILNRFSSDVNSIATNAITWIPSLIVAVFNFFATFGVIYYYDVTMAWLSLASAPVMVAASSILMRRMRAYSKRLRVLSSDVLSFEQEAFANMSSIKAFGITDVYADTFGVWQKKYKEYSMDYNLFSIKTNIFLTLIALATQFLTYGWGVYRLWGGYITYGQMTLFLSQSARLSSAFNSVAGMLPTALNSSVSARRVIELTDIPREKHLKEESDALKDAASDGISIHMNDVFFEYEKDKHVYREANFVANPGEVVGIIGSSGGGKTTFMRLALGLILPKDGRGYMEDGKGNQVDINSDTRQFIAYVPQGNTIMSGSVAENVRMVEREASDEAVIDALKDACAWEFVKELPEGIESSLFEHGGGISEGQAQRIAIARAVARKAPVLLLDEATSALDVETERNVLNNIIRRDPKRTIIVATHRPSVLSMCDRIYRIREEKLVIADDDELKSIYGEYGQV